MQRRGEQWVCVWCGESNCGYSRQRDPASATLDQFAADVAGLGLAAEYQTHLPEPARDTQPVFIVTTNDIPGYRITQVHGDVFGLVARAGTFSAI